MVIFRQTNHQNYAKEAALLLINYNFKISERAAAASRFVNTKGREGCNLPCDLHLEHLNRILKGTLSTIESHVQPKIIEIMGRAIGFADEIFRSFSDELTVQAVSRTIKERSLALKHSVFFCVLSFLSTPSTIEVWSKYSC